MTAAVLALGLVAAFIIIPAIAARRSSAGHRRLREHHRALDTLGHITSTRPDGVTERARSGFSALHAEGRRSVLTKDGLATDPTGPQAHVRVVSPSRRPLPTEGALGHQPRPTIATTGAAVPPSERAEINESVGAAGVSAAGGPAAPVAVPARPEEYDAANLPPVGADTMTLSPPAIDAPPAAPALEGIVGPALPVPPGPGETVPDAAPVEGRRTVTFTDDSASDAHDESAADVRPRVVFPGADPTVPAWRPRATGVPETAKGATAPSFPESPSATDEEAGDDVITAPVAVTDAEPPPAAPVEAPDHPVWPPAQPLSDRSASALGAPRGYAGQHLHRPPRSLRPHRGRVAGGVAAVIILAAVVGVVAAHALSGPAAKPKTSALPRPAATTTVTSPPSTAPPRPTTVPTTIPAPPFKLISNSPGISVYRIVGRPRITITATGECWTEILRGSADGTPLYIETMTSGARHVVRGPVWIRLGDPTAVTITVNGTKLKPPVTDGTPYDLQFE